MNPDESEALISILQAEIAFQGDGIRQLNDALAQQQQDLLLLKRQVVLLSEQLRGLRDPSRSQPATLADEKPPHY